MLEYNYSNQKDEEEKGVQSQGIDEDVLHVPVAPSGRRRGSLRETQIHMV